MKLLGNKFSDNDNFTLLRVGVDEKSIDKVVKLIQHNLFPKYYAHFYKRNELIVIFPKKIIRMTTSKKTWNEAVEYGKSVGIPAEQLDFFPCRVEDETY